MENINRVCSIEVSVEMIMYGYSSLSIYESEDGNSLEASWCSMNDGGDVTASGQKTFSGKTIDALAATLSEITPPNEENYDEEKHWSINLLNKDEEPVGGIEDGFWPTDSLKTALERIEKYLGNKQITRKLRKIIDM